MNLFWFLSLPKRVILFLIKFWQATLSVDHGLGKLFEPNGRCKYYPSCSQYAYEAIERFGLARGGYMACGRLLRCNPFSHGGNDPIQKNSKLQMPNSK